MGIERIVQYECKVCGRRIDVTRTGEVYEEPVYCCGLETTTCAPAAPSVQAAAPVVKKKPVKKKAKKAAAKKTAKKKAKKKTAKKAAKKPAKKKAVKKKAAKKKVAKKKAAKKKRKK